MKGCRQAASLCANVNRPADVQAARKESIREWISYVVREKITAPRARWKSEHVRHSVGPLNMAQGTPLFRPYFLILWRIGNGEAVNETAVLWSLGEGRSGTNHNNECIPARHSQQRAAGRVERGSLQSPPHDPSKDSQRSGFPHARYRMQEGA